jgi:Domain of unknown function (DUF4406)
MKIYVAGPIKGKPDRNLPAFQAAAEYLKMLGHTPIIPHDILAYPHDGQCSPGYDRADGHESTCYLRADLLVLLRCQAAYFIPGWKLSRGASLEYKVSLECGIQQYFWDATIGSRGFMGPTQLDGNSILETWKRMVRLADS